MFDIVNQGQTYRIENHMPRAERGDSGMTLVQVMIALALFALAFIPVFTMFQQAEVSMAQSENMVVGTALAQGELELLETGSFDDSLGAGYDWKPVEDLDAKLVAALGGFPQALKGRYERKLVVERIDDFLLRGVVSVRWNEKRSGKLLLRQINYATLVPRRTQYW
jgi:hypothetical protein